jgi:hypothetical protein
LSRLYPDDFEDLQKDNIGWDVIRGELGIQDLSSYYMEAEKRQPTNAGWNTHIANSVLFDVQNLLFNGKFHRAMHVLDNLEPLLGASMPERRVRKRIALFKSKTRQLQGEFRAALDHLEHFEDEVFKGLIPQYCSQTIELYCELGNTFEARHRLPNGNFLSRAWLLENSGRRVSLAAAGIYFIEGFAGVREGSDQAKESLASAKRIYKKLEKTYEDLPRSRVTLFRQFSIATCLAMITHLECFLQGDTSDWEDALAYWKSALAAATTMRQVCKWDEGFPEMIISFSMSDIEWRLQRFDKAVGLIIKGKELYKKSGRQFAWLALGTCWFELVGDWLLGRGYSRINADEG